MGERRLAAGLVAASLGEAEIDDDDRAEVVVALQEEVLELQIAVHDEILVHVVDAHEGALHHHLRLRLGVSLVLHLENGVEDGAAVKNLGDYIHMVLLGRDEVFLQVEDRLVLEVAQGLDLGHDLLHGHGLLVVVGFAAAGCELRNGEGEREGREYRESERCVGGTFARECTARDVARPAFGSQGKVRGETAVNDAEIRQRVGGRIARIRPRAHLAAVEADVDDLHREILACELVAHALDHRETARPEGVKRSYFCRGCPSEQLFPRSLVDASRRTPLCRPLLSRAGASAPASEDAQHPMFQSDGRR